MVRIRVLCLLVAIVAATVAAAPAEAQRRCSVPSGARVLDRSSEAVVFTRGTFRTFGCHRSAGRTFRLADEGGGIRGEDRGSTGRGRPRLAGRYVGYVTFGSAIGDEYDRMYVFDLVRGRPKAVAGSNTVSTFVLKRNGSVAWVQRSVVQPANPDENVYEVRRFSHEDRQGNVLLDRGPIDPVSLALSADRTTIAWTNAGAVRTAPLR